MKHSIFKIASVYNPSLPFPMPEPQRGRCLSILIAEARSVQVPPALLVTHLPGGEDRRYTDLRAKMIRRVMAEVDGWR